MPLIKMESSIAIPQGKKTEIIQSLSKLIAETTGKPEQYVMVTVSETAMSFGGTMEPTAFIDVRSIGSINSQINRNICSKVSALLEKAINIPGNRIYYNFTDVPGTNWGWNGNTFR